MSIALAHKSGLLFRYPDVLTRAKSSTVGLAKQLSESKDKLTRAFVTDTILRDSLGITDATKREINALMGLRRKKPIDLYLADMISLRAQLGVSSKTLKKKRKRQNCT